MYGIEGFHRYYLVAACAGSQAALDCVKKCYMGGLVTKDEYSRALRSFQAVHDEIDSDARKRFNKRVADGLSMYDVDELSPEKKVELVAAGILQCKYVGIRK